MKIKKQNIASALITLALALNINSGFAQSPVYKADVPSSLLTPDKVQTELLGELEFFDGMPSDATVKKTIDFLDLSRAVEVFLNGMPATSIYAMLEGMKKAGCKPKWVSLNTELQAMLDK